MNGWGTTAIATVGTIIVGLFGVWQSIRADRTERAKLRDAAQRADLEDEEELRSRFDASMQVYLARLEARIASLEDKLVISNDALDAERKQRRCLERKLDIAEQQVGHLEAQNRSQEIEIRRQAARILELEARLKP